MLAHTRCWGAQQTPSYLLHLRMSPSKQGLARLLSALFDNNEDQGYEQPKERELKQFETQRVLRHLIGYVQDQQGDDHGHATDVERFIPILRAKIQSSLDTPQQ